REVALGSVYATLERLEKKALVASELGEPTAERGGRAKKYFHVTTQGLREGRTTQRMLKKLWKNVPQLAGGAESGHPNRKPQVGRGNRSAERTKRWLETSLRSIGKDVLQHGIGGK